METQQVTLKWEKFGFKGPFRCLGVYELPSLSLCEQNPEAYRRALAEAPRLTECGVGSCHICGMAIKYNYIIRTQDNKTFVVGSDCINDKDRKLQTEAKEAIKVLRKQKREKAVENRLDLERARNGGLTDAQKEAKEREEKLAQARQEFYSKHQALFDSVKAQGNAFAVSVMETCVFWRQMTPKQLAVLEESIQNDKVLQEYWGVVGQKTEVRLRTVKEMPFHGAYGLTWVVILKDPEGRTYKYSGGAPKAFAGRGNWATVGFTVKAHQEYNGTLQTCITRPKRIGG